MKQINLKDVLKLFGILFFVVSLSQSVCAQTARSFSHPGLLNNSDEFSFIKKKLILNENPWKEGFQKLFDKSDFYLNYKPHKHVVVIANYGRQDPDSSRDNMTFDGEAVYANALLWYFTGKAAHAKKAIEIIDVWTNNFKKIVGDDSTLAVSYSWPHFLWGAEIIRDGYPGWSKKSQDNLIKLVNGLVYPVGSVYRHYSNWWSWSICLQITVGVYTNNREIFDNGIRNYFDQLDHYINEKGYCTEICRDLWHAQMGLMPMVASAEIAWKQGIDLYSKSDFKLYKAIEQIVPFVEGSTANWPCDKEPKETLKFWCGYEMAYNHFHNICGLASPNIYRAVQRNRPEGYNRIGYGTLTHAGTTQDLPINNFPSAAVTKIIAGINEIKIPDRLVNIIDYSGHAPDVQGSFDFRNFIQKAINELSSKGGGKLLFPHSQGADKWGKVRERYRIGGPIELRSNIQLIFQPSVILQFECDPVAYSNNKEGVITRYEGTTVYGLSPLFRAMNVENIVFSCTGGTGATPEIAGDGEKWLTWQQKSESARGKDQKSSVTLLRSLNNDDVPLSQRKVADTDAFFLRPMMLEFFLCKNILMDGIKLSNGPFWMVHPVFSQNMVFRNLVFDANIINNDGIDIESSKDVLIENVIFNNHDDNVVIKSGRDREGREGVLVKETELEKIKSEYIKNGRLSGSSENVVVRNCVFKGHNAFCIGSEMSGGVKNIYVLDNIAPQNVIMGIYIKSSRKRGGTVENIYVKNFLFNQVGSDVIGIHSNYDGDTISRYFPQIRNVYIENVTATNANNGIGIFGWKELPVDNVTLKNIQIRIQPERLTNTCFDLINANRIHVENVSINNKSFDGNYSENAQVKSVPVQR